MKLLFTILFAFCGANFSFCQNDSGSVSDSVVYYQLSVLSEPENARVYLDTAFIGITPVKNHSVLPGKYNLKLVNPYSQSDWRSENKLIELEIKNDTAINISFRYFYFFNSNPFNAEIIKSDSLFGITPFRFFSDIKITGKLTFRKNNYKDYIFDMNNYDFEKGAEVNLISKGRETINDVVLKNRRTQFKTGRNLYAILGLGAASLAGGFFSVNFKDKANTNYDKYLLTGDIAYLEESNKNDKYFIFSIILMQLAIGGLMYFLFFD